MQKKQKKQITVCISSRRILSVGDSCHAPFVKSQEFVVQLWLNVGYSQRNVEDGGESLSNMYNPDVSATEWYRPVFKLTKKKHITWQLHMSLLSCVTPVEARQLTLWFCTSMAQFNNLSTSGGGTSCLLKQFLLMFSILCADGGSSTCWVHLCWWCRSPGVPHIGQCM